MPEDIPAAADLMRSADIAGFLGVSRQRVQQLKSSPHFPKPAAQIGRGAVWRRSDIEAWARTKVDRTSFASARRKNVFIDRTLWTLEIEGAVASRVTAVLSRIFESGGDGEEPPPPHWFAWLRPAENVLELLASDCFVIARLDIACLSSSAQNPQIWLPVDPAQLRHALYLGLRDSRLALAYSIGDAERVLPRIRVWRPGEQRRTSREVAVLEDGQETFQFTRDGKARTRPEMFAHLEDVLGELLDAPGAPGVIGMEGWQVDLLHVWNDALSDDDRDAVGHVKGSGPAGRFLVEVSGGGVDARAVLRAVD
jgi:predicted DNA-binding transcriptional regulator AlpA